MGRSSTFRVGRTRVADEDLSGLRRRQRKVYAEACALIASLSDDPFIGYELRDEWAGARSVHFARDRYRLIWQIDDEDKTVVVLRVGRKENSRGGTIYEDGPPG